MYTIGKVSSTEALQLIERVVSNAQKLNKAVVIAVAGPEGELIAFLRMDGAPATSSVIAQNKAYTAARDRKYTRLLGDRMKEKGSPPAFWGDDRITGFGGGVPIIHGNIVIGGIGVSGLSSEEDEQLGTAAIQSVFGS